MPTTGCNSMIDGMWDEILKSLKDGSSFMVDN